jgi:ABC-2 type transport system permease protein
MAIFIPAHAVYPHIHNWFLFAAVMILASLLAGSLGLAIGSMVGPRQIGLVFSIIVVPITFLGCVYYPWAKLENVRWLQIGVLLNPIVYISEGLRAAVTPDSPHMPIWAVLLALSISLFLLGRLGLRGFLKRVIS